MLEESLDDSVCTILLKQDWAPMHNGPRPLDDLLPLHRGQPVADWEPHWRGDGGSGDDAEKHGFALE